MNFVNKLISRITSILALCIAFAQIVISLNYDEKDIMVFVLSIVFVVLTLANLGYAIYLNKKYNEDKEVKYNLIPACGSAFFSVATFIISMISYLYLIW